MNPKEELRQPAQFEWLEAVLSLKDHLSHNFYRNDPKFLDSLDRQV